MSSEKLETSDLDTIQAEYQAGKALFERGEYRQSVQHLETAKSLVNLNSPLGGEVQIWLVTAYEAVGQRSEAIDLCRTLTRHPDYTTRKEGKRILYILEAPRLKTRREWLTEIPDLSALADSEAQDRVGRSQYGATASPPRSPEPKPFLLEPTDLSQVNTRDNQFVWVALILTALTLAGLLWWSQG